MKQDSKKTTCLGKHKVMHIQQCNIILACDAALCCCDMTEWLSSSAEEKQQVFKSNQNK